jgi:hypothetical protein
MSHNESPRQEQGHMSRTVSSTTLKTVLSVDTPSHQVIPLDTQHLTTRVGALLTRAETLHTEYNQLLGGHDTQNSYIHIQEVYFLVDLCLNYEDISVRRKRSQRHHSIPPVMCKTIIEMACHIAETIASIADFEMVEAQLSAMVGNTNAMLDVTYDDHFVYNRRQQRIEEFINIIHQKTMEQAINVQSSTPGGLRLDARSFFLSIVKKALDMFMTKHNQVLVAGNSRLGRVKVPTCIACDRPLLEKVSAQLSVGMVTN